MRQVVVDETKEQATATPFSNQNAAFLAYKMALLAFIAADLDEDSDEYEDAEKATSIEDLGAWPECGPVLLIEEGDPGVWTGFSSADRSAIGGPLPLPDDDFVGNGDPSFYLTAGVPDGVAVLVTASVSGDDTHPLYASWLAAHGTHGDEDDEN